MSFLKKLKEADDEVKSSIVNITPNNKNANIVKSNKRSDYKDDYKDDKQSEVVLPFQAKNLWKDENNENDEVEQYDNIIDRDSILWKVSEYLFDLFDANCLDGYKKIEAFEDRIMKHFIDDNDEYTFEQERCHREFLDLFESLIEGFLKENKCTTQRFYEEVNKEMKKKKEENENANEVIEVICCYCDFISWVKYMKEESKKRCHKICKYDDKNDEVEQYNNIIDRDSILWKVSEYLFDLFDANCLDGYKKIEAFEDRIMKHFIDDNDEYTFEQERCHREFLDLFESLIEDFLKENKCTTQLFYAEVNLVMLKKSAHHNKEANEIVDIIFCYCDFRSWIEYMKEQARRRFTLVEQLSMNKAAAKSHRFESELNK